MFAQQFAFLDLGTTDLVIILAIILLLFGGKKLPGLSRSLGESMHELRKGFGSDINEHKTTEKEPDNKDVPA